MLATMTDHALQGLSAHRLVSLEALQAILGSPALHNHPAKAAHITKACTVMWTECDGASEKSSLEVPLMAAQVNCWAAAVGADPSGALAALQVEQSVKTLWNRVNEQCDQLGCVRLDLSY